MDTDKGQVKLALIYFGYWDCHLPYGAKLTVELITKFFYKA